MILIQTKQLGQGWSMQIRYGKRTTYALHLRNGKVKSFYSEDALHSWLLEMNIDLKAGA